jgi:hypothetical protein
MTYQVAVPTFNRPDVLARRTLSTLANGGVPPRQVTVVASGHDPQLDGTIQTAKEFGVQYIVLPSKGIHAVRQDIIRLVYPAGTRLLQMDDDVHQLEQVHGKKLFPVRNLNAFIREGFRRTEAAGLHAWGVAPVPNHFFLTENRWTEGLRFLIGTFIGQITRPGHPVHDMTVTLKEDYEASLRHYWYDGAVLRADGVAVKADHYTPGGVAAYRSHAAEEAAVQQLLAAWPGLVRRNPRRKTPEVVLAVRKRHGGHPHLPHEES